MSLRSAREKVPTSAMQRGKCFSTGLDAILPPNVELPEVFYDLFSEDSQSETSSYNAAVSLLLEDFFRVKPRPATDLAPIAKFNAFGASPQSYMADVTVEDFEERYNYLQRQGIHCTKKQLRLQELLSRATKHGCNVLFSNFTVPNEHVSGLQVIDDGRAKYDAQYVVRDYTDISTSHIYTSADFAGFTLEDSNSQTSFAPLPERVRPYFPDGQSSWELIILPPAPKPKTIVTVTK